MIKYKMRLLAATCACGLLTSGCENMNAGGMLGGLAGAGAGFMAGESMDDGSGTMTMVGAVIGGTLGMMLGSGAVTPGEMVQAAGEARVAETIGEAIEERNQQQAELNRLREAAERETAEKAAAEQRAADERVAEQRRMAAAGAEQQRAFSADAAAQQRAAEAERQRQAEQARQAEARAQQQRAAEQKAAEAAAQRRAAEEAKLAEAQRKRDEAARPVEWKEGVIVCSQPASNPQTKLGNWYCEGPLQMNYVKLGSPNADSQLRMTCGGGYGIRDLGTVQGYRVFGCGYGIHPSNNMRDYPGQADPAAEVGISYIPGRAVYRCPTNQTNICMTQ